MKNSNCNIYNKQRKNIKNIKQLQELVLPLNNGEHIVAVFDKGSCGFTKSINFVLLPEGFQQETYCYLVGAKKENQQMVVYVDIDNNKYNWKLLLFCRQIVRLERTLDLLTFSKG